MKQYGKSILIGALCTVLLTSCAITTNTNDSQESINPNTNSTINTPDSQQEESGIMGNSSASVPTEEASQSTTQPATSTQTKSDISIEQPTTLVYKEGNIRYPTEENRSELFELPDGIDSQAFYNLSEFLTIAIKSPLASIDQMDEETAHRFARTMMEYYIQMHPYLRDQMVIRMDGKITETFSSIPVSDFLDFTTRRFGVDDIQFFQNAIPPEDTVVRFELDQEQILVVPAMDSIASEFKTGHVEIQDSVLTFYAQSETLGELKYNFDISNGIDEFQLINVTEVEK